MTTPIEQLARALADVCAPNLDPQYVVTPSRYVRIALASACTGFSAWPAKPRQWSRRLWTTTSARRRSEMTRPTKYGFAHWYAARAKRSNSKAAVLCLDNAAHIMREA